MNAKTTRYDSWRKTAGFFRPGSVTRQTIKAHFDRFLRDRHSESLLPSRPVPAGTAATDWGGTPPFERVIRSRSDLTYLMTHPDLHQPAVTLIEPWPDVGTNPEGRPVRASLNLAHALQTVGDVDSALCPAWNCLDDVVLRELAGFASRGLAFVVEGGAPSVYAADTFCQPACSRDRLLELIQLLLLGRKNGGAPGIFICLGHQLASAAHVQLLQRAVREILNLHELPGGDSERALGSLNRAADEILQTGQTVGWDEPMFAVGEGPAAEIRGSLLTPYFVPTPAKADLPGHVLDGYENAMAGGGIIDVALQFAGQIKVDMFHTDVATERGALFCSWAYSRLHEAIGPHRELIGASDQYWLLDLPFAVKISSSTRKSGRVVTANAATCILYRDFQTGAVQHSYTTQFHPELTDDLQDLRSAPAPDYETLKRDPSKRMLIRLLRETIGV